ncbi:MAG: glycosyltransferase [Deltaproteobacteria bacterium]|nr:glycosyltransferase [Deltaproteobacteria bacterium]MBW2152203.1 glycosyltransferase [Deltaproteobacteria bacterium]
MAPQTGHPQRHREGPLALPQMSVIVPASRNETLRNTLGALLTQSIPENRYEIILVVPSDRVFDIPPASSIKKITTNRLFPPGKMRNIGAKHASGEILFFVDDDCIPPPSWLEYTYHLFCDNRKVGAMGCRVAGIKGTFWDRCADYALFSRYQHKSGFYGHLGSAALAIRKEAFFDVNGFEESLLASEDWDISIKLEKNGWLCRFDPCIEVLHDHQRDSLLGILSMGFKSGYRSGLFVQERHKKQMSPAALILLKFKHPFIYPIAMLPYAVALTVFWILEHSRGEPRIFLFSPFIFLSRLSYQMGVWTRLLKKKYSADDSS